VLLKPAGQFAQVRGEKFEINLPLEQIELAAQVEGFWYVVLAGHEVHTVWPMLVETRGGSQELQTEAPFIFE